MNENRIAAHSVFTTVFSSLFVVGDILSPFPCPSIIALLDFKQLRLIVDLVIGISLRSSKFLKRVDLFIEFSLIGFNNLEYRKLSIGSSLKLSRVVTQNDHVFIPFLFVFKKKRNKQKRKNNLTKIDKYLYIPLCYAIRELSRLFVRKSFWNLCLVSVHSAFY